MNTCHKILFLTIFCYTHIYSGVGQETDRWIVPEVPSDSENKEVHDAEKKRTHGLHKNELGKQIKKIFIENISLVENATCIVLDYCRQIKPEYIFERSYPSRALGYWSNGDRSLLATVNGIADLSQKNPSIAPCPALNYAYCARFFLNGTWLATLSDYTCGNILSLINLLENRAKPISYPICIVHPFNMHIIEKENDSFIIIPSSIGKPHVFKLQDQVLSPVRTMGDDFSYFNQAASVSSRGDIARAYFNMNMRRIEVNLWKNTFLNSNRQANLTWPLTALSCSNLIFSPDSKLLVVVARTRTTTGNIEYGDTLYVYNIKSNDNPRLTHTIENTEGIHSLCFLNKNTITAVLKDDQISYIPNEEAAKQHIKTFYLAGGTSTMSTINNYSRPTGASVLGAGGFDTHMSPGGKLYFKIARTLDYPVTEIYSLKKYDISTNISKPETHQRQTQPQQHNQQNTHPRIAPPPKSFFQRWFTKKNALWFTGVSLFVGAATYCLSKLYASKYSHEGA